MHREPEHLRVLDAARRFGEQCVDIAQGLPRRAPTSLRSQLAKSGQAVSDLLAEGFGRGTPGEKIRYCQMAAGTLAESQNQLRRCVNRRLIDRKTFYRSWNLSVAIDRMLSALIDYFDAERDETKELPQSRLSGATAPATAPASPPAPL